MGGEGPEKTREVGCFQVGLAYFSQVRSVKRFFEVFIPAIITNSLKPPIIKEINFFTFSQFSWRLGFKLLLNPEDGFDTFNKTKLFLGRLGFLEDDF